MGIKVVVTTSAKIFNKPAPRIALAGVWMNEIGFKIGSLVAIQYLKDGIILMLQGEGTLSNYREAAKKLLRNKSYGLVHVYGGSNVKKAFPHLEIKGARLGDAGFAIETMVAVKYDHGIIHLKAIDFDKIQNGF